MSDPVKKVQIICFVMTRLKFLIMLLKVNSVKTRHVIISIQLFHTFLCNNQSYHPQGAVDDPMNCCPRPNAEGNSSSGHPQHQGGDNLTVAQKGMK